MLKWLAVLILLVSGAQSVSALTCSSETWEGANFTRCEVDMTDADLRLFLYGEAGEVLGQFGIIDAKLAERGQQLTFAMNAGMYHSDRSPVGLYIEEGREIAPLITRSGPGNFGLVPNGVFCIRAGRADVIETRDYAANPPACRFATQSGPMLVIGGALHPRFLPDSNSVYVRNGVGTTADGKRVVFVIADDAVNFHTFGRYFRDVLTLPNALYLDGNISRLWAPQINRSDFGFAMGPVVGLVTPR